jgi:tRNA threonylcarbamoyladenosine biosynthesis protein TsaB
MLPLAELAIAKGNYEDVAYFEPFYLKDFVAIKSKSPLA